MRPYLVKAIVDHSGKPIRIFSPLTRRNVISPKTAQKVKAILEEVVSEDGTAPKAAIQGYTVSGKTGTAQKVDPIEKTYSNKKFVAFFGGFVPSDSPAITILVALDEPKGKPYGGIVAAPVFSDVGGWTLSHLNVVPLVPSPKSKEASHPILAYPRTKEEEIVPFSPDMPDLIPNVRGLGVRDVLKKARHLGLRVIVKGSGLAVEQSPAPGSPIKNDKLLVVTFEPPC